MTHKTFSPGTFTLKEIADLCQIYFLGDSTLTTAFNQSATDREKIKATQLLNAYMVTPEKTLQSFLFLERVEHIARVAFNNDHSSGAGIFKNLTALFKNSTKELPSSLKQYPSINKLLFLAQENAAGRFMNPLIDDTL